MLRGHIEAARRGHVLGERLDVSARTTTAGARRDHPMTDLKLDVGWQFA